jgi:predicted nucleic acid-binding protein
MRIFLDANILFSAAKSDGAIRSLLQRLVENQHECWADDYVVNEARRNLNLKGPSALSAFEAVLSLLHVRTLHASAPAFEDIDWLPAKDQPVLIAAARLHCDVLVTGDRSHFGPGYGKTFRGVTIHSPRSLAELLFT